MLLHLTNVVEIFSEVNCPIISGTIDLSLLLLIFLTLNDFLDKIVIFIIYKFVLFTFRNYLFLQFPKLFELESTLNYFFLVLSLSKIWNKLL